MKFQNLLFACYLFLSLLLPLEGSLIQRYNTITAGGITFTGNTLGLSKLTRANEPGINDSIGAFITTNTLSQVGSYPPGTTLTWQNNSSTAYLDLPPGSTVLYAELIWGGSANVDGALSGNEPDSNITMITPDSVSHTIVYDPTTRMNAVSPIDPPMYDYTRSAIVTSLVAAAGPGLYTVGGVAATTVPYNESGNCAGWTLAVVYSNPEMHINSLTLWVGIINVYRGVSPPPLLELTGFCTPSTGDLIGSVFISALEGDANITGDNLLFSSTTPLSAPADSLSGINNPENNFFCSQMNTLINYTVDGSGKIVPSLGMLDTRGSFGLLNADPFTATLISGGRQGYDITSVDCSSHIVYNQTTAYIQPITEIDAYFPNAIGLNIRVSAPILSMSQLVNGGSSVHAVLNDIVTLTFTIENMGDVAATSAIFTDILPSELTFISGSFKINSVTQPDPNLVTGVSIPNIPVAGVITLEFQVQITSIPISPTESTINNYCSVNFGYIPCSSAMLNGMSDSNDISIVLPSLELPVANDVTGTTVANTIYNGPSVLIDDTGVNILVTSYTAPLLGSVVMDTSTADDGGAVVGNGTFEYTPPTGYSGNDSFTYTITDAYNNTATATVFMTILPQAVSVDIYTTTVNTTLVNPSPSVLYNDIGTDLSIVSYDAVTSAGGSVSMIVSGVNAGKITYIPPVNFVGIDNFNYTIQDSPNLNQSTATVTITVTNIQPPTNFIGCVKTGKFLNSKKSILYTSWTPSSTPSVAYYRIYRHGTVVAVIPASSAPFCKICLKSKNQASEYQIAAVDSDGAESYHIPITLTSDCT